MSKDAMSKDDNQIEEAPTNPQRSSDSVVRLGYHWCPTCNTRMDHMIDGCFNCGAHPSVVQFIPFIN